MTTSSKRWDLNPRSLDTTQTYAVVLLPHGVSQYSAKASDYVRVLVSARDDLDARTAAAVGELVRAGKHYVVSATPSSQEAPRLGAAPADGEDDPGLRSPNTARPSGRPYFPVPRLG